MGFFSALLGLADTPPKQPNNNDHYDRELTAKDYIKFGEIEEDSYDDRQQNYIDEHGWNAPDND